MYPQVRGFQDLGTKKNGELERRSLSKIEQGGTGGCRPPAARGSGGLEAKRALERGPISMRLLEDSYT